MKYLMILCAVCLVACGNRASKRRQTPEPPARYDYQIVASYPHDPQAYTQGLMWHDGALIESTGEYGRSTLRRVALETGEVTHKISLDNRSFGEGAAMQGGKIYQLTWMEERCLVYDAATFAPAGEFTYSGEGWGLTSDGERLYMSDGTPNITVRNARTFAVEKTIVVRNEGRTLQYINELEWIDGRIWANVYLTNEIVIIDPADGRVEGIIDLSNIVSQIDITPSTDVMNGIAHDPDKGRIFITGKNWNRLFEIKITRR
jgi:glutamine cyclotransferase